MNIEEHQRLRAEYNPDGSPLRKHQLAMLDILKYIDKICRENNITYWLSSGSCLGAIRHGGFIPWDDDIDIEMLREDYLRFIRVFKSTDQYVLQTYKNDLFYFTVFAKVRSKNTQIYESLYKYKGVFVDVFSLEYTNKTLAFIAEKIRKPVSWGMYNFIKKHKKNLFVLAICVPVYVIFKYLYFAILPLFRIITKVLPGNRLRHTYGVGWVSNERVESEIMEPVRVPFEDAMLPVPADYNGYLIRIYGPNYMTVPSRKDISNHHVEFFDV